MDDKQKEKYISLVNDLYFRFQNNEEIKQRFKNENVYNEFLKSLKIFYENRNYIEATSLSYNIDSIINILNHLNQLTEDSSSILVHNVQVIQYANQLISACDELFPISKENVIPETEFLKRYNDLLNNLSSNPEDSNLILKTKTEQKEFR